MKKILFTMLLFVCALFGCATVQQEAAQKVAEIESQYKRNGYPLLILEAGASSPNNAGGVDYNFHYKNLGKKPIKYIFVNMTAYNRVGDKVVSDIKRTSTVRLKDVGPVAPAQFGGGLWEAVIYSYEISELRINSIEIIYMDGSKKVVKNSKKMTAHVPYSFYLY